MEGNNTFTYQYSAKQSREVEKIREKYLPQEESKLDRLKKLDRKVQAAGMVPSLCIGVIGVLLFGIGMCFGLGVFGGAAFLKYLFGIVGIAVMLPAYPVYRYLARKTKEQLTPEILQLSEELMRG